MTLAKSALTLALLLPAAVQAQGVFDTHFNSGGCYIRNYSPRDLANHPDQLVVSISLAPVPLETPKGVKMFNLMVNLRGSKDFPSGIAYCKAKGKAMACQLEGDGGSFTIRDGKTNGRQPTLLLTVGKAGIVLEGQDGVIEISGTSGDDKVFRLLHVSNAFCS